MHKMSNIAIIEEMRPDCKRETATSPKNAKAAEKNQTAFVGFY